MVSNVEAVNTLNLNSGHVYDFVMCAPAILGARYESARLLSKDTVYEAACRIQGDLIAKHTASLPSLKAGTPRSAKDLIYLIIQTLTGEVIAIAVDWLAAPPVEVVTTTVQVTIYGAKLSDQRLIRDLLVSGGFPSLDVKTV